MDLLKVLADDVQKNLPLLFFEEFGVGIDVSVVLVEDRFSFTATYKDQVRNGLRMSIKHDRWLKGFVAGQDQCLIALKTILERFISQEEGDRE